MIIIVDGEFSQTLHGFQNGITWSRDGTYYDDDSEPLRTFCVFCVSSYPIARAADLAAS